MTLATEKQWIETLAAIKTADRERVGNGWVAS